MSQNKVPTMDLKGKEYAQVKDRLKQFREDCPNGMIETVPTFDVADGGVNSILFKAIVVKDLSDEHSARATGHALGKVTGKDKEFEKLETIAVGRALALLGYGTDGAIASSDEMEEFEAYRKQKTEEALMEYTGQITSATSLDELKAVWSPIPIELKQRLEKVKDEQKERLLALVSHNENANV